MNLNEQLFAHNADRRLFGLPIQQNHAALLVYEQLLHAHRENIHWIVEIGTGSGALSMFWALWTQSLPCLTQFFTYDLQRCDGAVLETLRKLRCSLRADDCFASSSRFEIQSVVAEEPGLLFLDGGDKPHELAVFGPMACKGSLVIVHDYGVESVPGAPLEVSLEDIKRVPEVEFLQPWHDQSMELQTKAAILERV